MIFRGVDLQHFESECGPDYLIGIYYRAGSCEIELFHRHGEYGLDLDEVGFKSYQNFHGT